MTYPNIVKTELDAAIAQAIACRGEYINTLASFTRQRKLPMETVIKLLLSMQGGSLNKELHDSGIGVTASAFVQQRAKVSSSVFHDVLQSFNNAHNDPKTFRGYRILAIDGTCINMARNPHSESYVCNESNPKGYNQLHLNPFYDVCSKTYFDCVVQPQPKTDEIGALNTMLYKNRFSGNNLIIADRGYESYNMFAHLLNRENVDFLIHVKQDRSAMREIQKLPMTELDCNVSFTITTTQTNEDKRNNYIFLQMPSKKSRNSPKTRTARWDFPSPYPMSFRVVRFMLDTGEYEKLLHHCPTPLPLTM